ncbi:MAG: DUF2752 domain-containing protein [Planctomycetales bacterium]|nr:DUF2752 domain-containing protein [Planctomycetales bacterium]
MSDELRASNRALASRGRWAAAAMAAALSGLLIAAAWAVPDARGFGTHEQLGLAPCQFRSFTGHACPSCGMTTAWAYLVRGDVPRALKANMAGAVLGAAAMAAVPWLLFAAASGVWLWRAPCLEPILYVGTLWLALVALDWVRRMATGM